MVVLVCYYTDDKKYDKLLEVSINSFKYFHKNESYELHTLKKSDLCTLDVDETLPPGVAKFEASLKLAKKIKASKLIILGADTIICSRLDEFFDDNFNDLLTTLDYPYKIPIDIKNSNENNHLNADVICINNLHFLECLLDEYKKNPKKFHPYFEQGALNWMIFSEEYSFKNKIVDSPYPESKVSYNARGKGNIISMNSSLDFKPYINKYKVINDELFTYDGCKIKVFHYCQGLGCLSYANFEEVMNLFIFEMFNENTRQFFNKISKTNFFNTKFKL